MNAIVVLSLTLLILMALVGGKQGLASFLALAVNALLMILAVILMASGFQPVIVALLFGLIILATTIFLATSDLQIAGPAFVASVFVMGLLVLLIMVTITVAQTAGFGPEDSEALEGFSVMIGINFSHVLIATGLLGTLGAIAEAAIAISAGMAELNTQVTAASVHQMSEEIIGTALNTLFFGFFGGFSALFIWFAQLQYPLSQIVNNKIFVGELLLVLLSVIAVVLTVPVTEWIVNTRRAHREED